MRDKIVICLVFIFIVFITGCYSYHPVMVHFPVSISSDDGKSVKVEVENNIYTVSPWIKLDSRRDIYKENMKVLALNTLDKVVLSVGDPSALEDFNDDRADLDPYLIHVNINGQKQNNISINNGLFYFFFYIKNTGATSSQYVLDLDYNNLFKTRVYIYIYWLNEQEFKKI